MSNIILQDGKPVFMGKEDPNNPPVRPVGESSKMECPVCHGMFDYLVGENTTDGGVQGCESCYKPGKSSQTGDVYDKTKEIL